MSSLLQTVKEAFRPLPYDKEQAYESILTVDGLTLLDPVAMRELVLVYREAREFEWPEWKPKSAEDPCAIYFLGLVIQSTRKQWGGDVSKVFEDYFVRGLNPERSPETAAQMSDLDLSSIWKMNEEFYKIVDRCQADELAPLTPFELKDAIHHEVVQKGFEGILPVCYQANFMVRLSGRERMACSDFLQKDLDKCYITFSEED